MIQAKVLAFLFGPIGRALGLLILVALVVAGIYHAGVVHERGAWEDAVREQKLAATALKLEGERKARMAEGRAAQLGVQVDKERIDHEKQIAVVRDTNRGLVADIDRLRQAARRRPGGADQLPDASRAACIDPGGAAFGEFLDAVAALSATSEGHASEADLTAIAGLACHAYTVRLPAAMKGP